MIWYFLIGLLFVEFVAIVMFLPNHIVREVINDERMAAATWFGQEKTIAMIHAAEDRYHRWIEESGLKDVVYDTFYTDQRLDRGNAAFNWVNDERLFGFVNERLDSFFKLLQAMLFRLDMFLICMLLSLLILVPTLIDGLCKWQIARSSDNNASINIYNVSERIFYSLLIIPIYAFFLPIALTPLAFSIWMGCLCFMMHLMASNLQHRI